MSVSWATWKQCTANGYANGRWFECMCARGRYRLRICSPGKFTQRWFVSIALKGEVMKSTHTPPDHKRARPRRAAQRWAEKWGALYLQKRRSR